jgi:hypothetical protein
MWALGRSAAAAAVFRKRRRLMWFDCMRVSELSFGFIAFLLGVRGACILRGEA